MLGKLSVNFLDSHPVLKLVPYKNAHWVNGETGISGGIEQYTPIIGIYL